MSGLARTGDPAGGMSRAEAYLRAGEQWLLADDPGEAADAFRRAIADGGQTFGDPRVALARALFQLGERQQATTIMRQIEAEGPRDARRCDLVAELLIEMSDLPGALHWLTAGIRLSLPGRPDPDATVGAVAIATLSEPERAELRLLLNLRFRLRNDLGLAEDGYDRLTEVLGSPA